VRTSPFNAFQFIQGLGRSCQNARAVTLRRWRSIAAPPQVARVIYPGLRGRQQRRVAEHTSGRLGLVGFELRQGLRLARAS
jgi:O-acetylhomoserine/O-acetylserine sulfhydrylase-like pyridoxal-dependent enzyme